MTIESLKTLPEYVSLNNICYERFYRNLALGFSNVESKADEYTQQLYSLGYVELDKCHVANLEKVMPAIFFDADSSNLLWFLQCCRTGSTSLLATINSYIRQISTIKRGGINTYKRNGWDVHVLYVYQLINYNFSKNIIPKALKWNFDVEPIISQFHQVYHELSLTSKFILNIGSFIHDIGVTIAINNHELRGIPLVEQYYHELRISSDVLKDHNIEMNQDEIITALKLLVGNHQIINQIAAEVSDKIIWKKVQKIKESLNSEKLEKFLTQDFSKVMYLLGAADVMAVDDSLLSNVKYDEMTESFHYLQSLIDNGDYNRNKMKYGIKRLKCFISDDLKDISDEHLCRLIAEHGASADSIWNFIYNVQEINYGVAAIKPLNDLNLTVKFIISLYLLITKYTNDYSKVVVNIRADFDSAYIEELLRNHSATWISEAIKHETKKMNDEEIIELNLNRSN